jgi:hypothetical protein
MISLRLCAYVESVNQAIRAIINRVYGYRNLENCHLQLQILAQHGPPALLPH